MGGIEIILAIIVITILGTLVRTFRVIPQARVGIIQRLGNYNRTAEAGLTVVMPFIDKMLPLIDMREQVVSFPPQPVITSDNVTINVTSVIYYQIHRREGRELPGNQSADGDGTDRPDHAAQCNGQPVARRQPD